MQQPKDESFWLFLRALWPQTKLQLTGEVAAVVLAIYSLLGATVPGWVAWLLSSIVFFFASYKAWSHENDKYEEAMCRLAYHEDAPIRAAILDPTDHESIVVRVTNNSDTVQRVLSVSLLLHSFKGEMELLPSNRIIAFTRAEQLPHVMLSHASFEVRFFSTRESLLQYGVKIFHAVVETEDGRNVISRSKVLASTLQKTPLQSKTLREGLDREERIDGFVRRYTAIWRQKQGSRPDLSDIAVADVTKLHDGSELKAACTILSMNSTPHHFVGCESAEEFDVLEFFQQAQIKKTMLTGIQGEFELMSWRKTNARLLFMRRNLENEKRSEQ